MSLSRASRAAAGVAAAACCTALAAQQVWKIHDLNRPQPRVIDAGSAGCGDKPGRPPSDAVVLFDGTDLGQWRASDGGPAPWRINQGALESVGGTAMIWTRQPFGDCQLHVEWSAPVPPSGEGQKRGNSGIYLMGKYELQVLDSYDNMTYADGHAGAVYGQYPPLVNAARPPGKWQTYDIVFHAPRFGPSGSLVRRARFTVLYNGVLVQDDVELTGPTEHKIRLPYQAHPEKLPFALQDHASPVRFRNIWIRELPEPEPPAVP